MTDTKYWTVTLSSWQKQDYERPNRCKVTHKSLAEICLLNKQKFHNFKDCASLICDCGADIDTVSCVAKSLEMKDKVSIISPG